jgi:hypothetical protein
MSIIVLLQHGVLQDKIHRPNNSELMAMSLMNATSMAEAALSIIPTELRFPRPIIPCGPEEETRKTAEWIAELFHTSCGVCDALSENPQQEQLLEFATICLSAKRPMIAVTHHATIDAFIEEIIRVSRGIYRVQTDGDPSHSRGIFVDPDRMIIGIVKPLPRTD